jgi:hypothetical protein
MASLAPSSNGLLGASAPGPDVYADDGRGLWAGVDALVDKAQDLDALVAHRLHLLAAERWSRIGRPVPGDLAFDRRSSAFQSLIVGVLLERIRGACDGPMVLIKGPEAASYYRDPALRPFRDLDLLVPDAQATQAALLGAGFELAGDERLYRNIHHLRPVIWPDMPFFIEIHERPKWPEHLSPPTVDELLASAVPSRTGVDGILALPPAQHALLLAAHGWAHIPLRRLLDLVDVAAVADQADQRELRTLARAWGLTKLWRTTESAVDALFFGGPTPLTLRTWAHNLRSVQQRTLVQSHLARTFSSFWALPVHRAVRETGAQITQRLRPEPGEGWRTKLARSARALRNPFSTVADHDRAMEARGLQAPSMKEVRIDEPSPESGRSELARD